MSNIGTDILNLFDIKNEIINVRGTFRYRFFDPKEQVEESCRFLNNPNDPREVPRYNLIEWSQSPGGKTLIDIGLDEESQLIHKVNFFFASDLSTTYCLLTTDSKELSQQQSEVISDGTTGSKLDYLLKTVASNEYTEDIESNLDSKTDASKIPVLDPTTNKPLVQTTISGRLKTQEPDLYIHGAHVSAVLEKSNYSPLGGMFSGNLEKAKLYSDKFVELNPNGKKKLTSFEYVVDKIRSSNESAFYQISRKNRPDDFLRDWSLVGWVVSKYRVSEGKETYMYTRFVKEPRYRDPYVAYGKTYNYRIQPVLVRYVSNEKLGNTYVDNDVVFISSQESASIQIECTELKVPTPPRNPRFEYVLGENIKVSWERPESYITDEGKLFDTNDIKGYQLFLRNSLTEPYRLYRYFTFNNTVPSDLRMRSAELISDDYVISSEYDFPDSVDPDNIPNFYEHKEYTLSIRSNVDYYFALCSIDAHGNSSNYSAQYKVRRNNVTGEVDIQLVSSVGAPKQYPNLLIPGKLVQPSFKASGYRYMDVYYAPDSAISSPSMGESVNIQLFELETEEEKNITITLNRETI